MRTIQEVNEDLIVSNRRSYELYEEKRKIEQAQRNKDLDAKLLELAKNKSLVHLLTIEDGKTYLFIGEIGIDEEGDDYLDGLRVEYFGGISFGNVELNHYSTFYGKTLNIVQNARVVENFVEKTKETIKFLTTNKLI